VPDPVPDADSEPVEPDQPEAEVPDLRGMWTGMVGTKAFILRLQAQSGPAFSGRAEVLQPSGTWARYSVTGSMDVETGAVSFSNLTGAVSFTGSVSDGPMTGTMTADGQTESLEISR